MNLRAHVPGPLVLASISRRAPWPMLATASRFSPIQPAPLPDSLAAKPPIGPVAPYWPQDRATYRAARQSVREAAHRDHAETEHAQREDAETALYDGPSIAYAQRALAAIYDPRMRKAMRARPSIWGCERVTLHGDQLRRRDAVKCRVGVRRMEAERRARIEAYAAGEP